MREDYYGATIEVVELEDGWQYRVTMFDGAFLATHREWIGPHSAMEAAKTFVDVMMKELNWS